VQPPTLVVWGKHDLSFTIAGAVAYGEDLPEAEVHLLDAGHFALDEAAPQIAELIRSFVAVRGWTSRRDAHRSERPSSSSRRLTRVGSPFQGPEQPAGPCR